MRTTILNTLLVAALAFAGVAHASQADRASDEAVAAPITLAPQSIGEASGS
ncbi:MULTISPECIES: hypothetical protein [Marinobacter]|uniref:hypothetical protein n=1 Tax=Marinobacter TaxID=2742 RepID=UPI0013A6973E|nr:MULTISPECIES: hypothetical protein [Marinobacter]